VEFVLNVRKAPFPLRCATMISFLLSTRLCNLLCLHGHSHIGGTANAVGTLDPEDADPRHGTSAFCSRMREEDTELYQAFLAAADAISRIRPMPPSTQDVMRRYFHGFKTSEVRHNENALVVSCCTACRHPVLPSD
jgi:hypothetical protein